MEEGWKKKGGEGQREGEGERDGSVRSGSLSLWWWERGRRKEKKACQYLAYGRSCCFHSPYLDARFNRRRVGPPPMGRIKSIGAIRRLLFSMYCM